MRRALALLLAAATLPGCGHSAKPHASPSPSTSLAPDAPLTPASGQPSQVALKVLVGGQPCGVVAAAGSVWVTDAQRAVLLRIRDGNVAASTPLDASPCEVTYGAGALWVATQSGKLDRVDPHTGKVTAHIKVGAVSYEPVVAYGFVWVTNRNGNSVSKVDPRTNKVVATIRLPFVNAGGIVAAAGSLWVGDDSDGATAIVRLDPKSGTTAKVDTGGNRPAFVAAASGYVYVANEGSGTVSRIDARTGRLVGSVAAGVRPVNLSALPGPRPEVWVPDDQGNLLVRIDAAKGTVLERLRTGTGPAVVAPDGSTVWVSNFGDGTVWQVRPGDRS